MLIPSGGFKGLKGPPPKKVVTITVYKLRYEKNHPGQHT